MVLPSKSDQENALKSLSNKSEALSFDVCEGKKKLPRLLIREIPFHRENNLADQIKISNLWIGELSDQLKVVTVLGTKTDLLKNAVIKASIPVDKKLCVRKKSGSVSVFMTLRTMFISCNAPSAKNLAIAQTALTLVKLLNHLVGYAG